MKELKIIGGIICITLAIVALGGAFNGAPLMFSGVFIWGIVAFILFRSANKEKLKTFKENVDYDFNKTNRQKKRESNKVIYREHTDLKKKNFTENTERVILTAEEQKESLIILKQKGVLDNSEYEEKFNQLNEQIIKAGVYKTIEYQSLIKIRDSGLLTNEEFEEKKKRLIIEYDEYYLLIVDGRHSEFSWNMYQSKKLNIKKPSLDYEYSDFLGKWKFKNGQILFYETQKFGYKKVKITWVNGMNRYGEWKLNNSMLNVRLDNTFGFDKVVFNINELGSHVFVYTIKNKKYTTYRVLTNDKNEW